MAYSVFTQTLASAATLTPEFNLGEYYEKVSLALPSMSTATAVYVQASPTSGGTYKRVDNVAGTSFTVATAFADNIIFPIPAGYRYMKVEFKTAPADGHSIQLICARN
jgi:hypothetical protein